MPPKKTQKAAAPAQAPAPPLPSVNVKMRSRLHYSVDAFKNGEISLPTAYICPTVKYVDTSTTENPIICPATEILRLDRLRNPMMIFGQPFSGKTSLFMKLATQVKANYGAKHWIGMVDLRQAALRCLSTQKWPSDIIEFLAEPLNMSQNALRNLFKPLGNANELLRLKKYEKLTKGELFLDGFDEIPVAEREYFLKLLPQLRTQRHYCPIRVWINCRSYFKDRILEVMGTEGAFEIMDYTKEFQKDMLYNRWKEQLLPEVAKKYEEKRLEEYASLMHDGFCNDIKQFEKTIGTCPHFLKVISDVFVTHANEFMLLYRKVRQDVLAGASGHDHEDTTETGTNKKKKKKKKAKGAAADDDNLDVVTAPTAQIMCQLEGTQSEELFEYLTHTVIEIYFLKYHSWRNLTEMDYQTLLQREQHRAIHIYAQFAIRTYPLYEHEALIPSVDDPTALKQNLRYIVDEELHHMGLLVITGKNALVQYHNKSMGDYFLAKYFSIANNLIVRNPHFDTFFLRVLLFEREAQPVRSFYNSIMQYGANVGEYRPEILHDFLVRQYKLDNEDEWEQIRNDGSAWHVAVMEGFHRTAVIMVQCFNPTTERDKVRKLLRIKAPVDVLEGDKTSPTLYRINGGQAHSPRHLVSSMSLIAMFAYDVGMEELFNIMLTFFTVEEIREELSAPDAWNPVQYAAIHSNLWFMMYLYNDAFKAIQPPPGIYNLNGQLPIHLLMSHTWHHIMVLKDRFFPEYDTLGGCFFGANNKCSANKTSRQLNPSLPNNVQDCNDDCDDDDDADKIVYRKSRELLYYRDMAKEIKGPGMGILLRLAHHECIRLLIKVGGEDVNAAELKTGNTMLHYAAKHGWLDTVKYLLGLGASVMPTNVEGMTPLHYAGAYGHRYVFMYLVKNYRSKATLRDNRGQSSIAMWKLRGARIDKARNGPMSPEEREFFQLYMGVNKIKAAPFKREKEMAAKREQEKARKESEQKEEEGKEDKEEDNEEEESSEESESDSSYDDEDNDNNDGEDGDDGDSDCPIPPYEIDDYVPENHNNQKI